MKKPLLLGLSIALGVAMSAQGNFRKKPVNAPIKKVSNFTKSTIDKDVQFPKRTYAPLSNNNAKITAPPYKKISTSFNLLTAIVAQSNCLNYNKDLNAVSFVHRQSSQWTFAGSNSGNAQITYTTNNGTTWDSLVFGLCNGSGVRYRYPSGAIYNPTGNTNIANAFAVGAGPITDGGNWIGDFYSSGQLNNTNVNTVNYMNATPTAGVPFHHFSRVGFDLAGNKAKVAGQLCIDPSGTTVPAIGFRGMSLATGTFNTGTNNFDWTFDTLNILSNVQVDNVASEPYVTYEGYTSWSDNGQIGYNVFFGVDVAATTPNTRTWTPIVFKTTNGGTSWAQYMPGFDWTTVDSILPYIASYDGVNAKPFFSISNGVDFAVDANGDLHIAAQILTGASDDQDSLGYIFNVGNFIFDCWTTSAGWNAQLIDSISADASNQESSVVWSDQSTSPPGLYDNDARLQISKSVNGDKLFFGYVDTDISLTTDPINVQPFLVVKGVDVNSRCWTAEKTFTATSDFAYYHFISQRAMSPTATTYGIPATYVNSADGSFNAINPINHFYVDDITFSDADFSLCPNIGFGENEAMLSAINVYPNPTNGNATLSVKVKEANEISVNLYNTIGQLVITKKVKGEVGVNKINLATENLASGIYFYEVKVADFTITNKMMIQK
ncbi:MAG: T9SS type A sorting domain-containing protein [Bacteroidia bacterium]|nr:T9SS type A sorting domain-containing protein [Bacteroidia bacterium]